MVSLSAASPVLRMISVTTMTTTISFREVTEYEYSILSHSVCFRQYHNDLLDDYDGQHYD